MNKNLVSTTTAGLKIIFYGNTPCFQIENDHGTTLHIEPIPPKQISSLITGLLYDFECNILDIGPYGVVLTPEIRETIVEFLENVLESILPLPLRWYDNLQGQTL